MKFAPKRIPLLAVIALLFLLNACGPGSLPYKVWKDWDEMKKVLGDHYLYPTYLPEYTERAKSGRISSDYNFYSDDPKTDGLFYGYLALYWEGGTMDDWISLSANDYGKMKNKSDPMPTDTRERYHVHTVTLGGVDVQFYTVYELLGMPYEDDDPDEWYKYHARNSRTVRFTFQIGTVTYGMSWIQYDVDDMYADGEQTNEMLKVALSIIEQATEVE